MPGSILYDLAEDGAKIYDARIGLEDAERRLKKWKKSSRRNVNGRLGAVIVKQSKPWPRTGHYYVLQTAIVVDGGVAEYLQYRSDGRVVALLPAQHEIKPEIEAAREQRS